MGMLTILATHIALVCLATQEQMVDQAQWRQEAFLRPTALHGAFAEG